MSAGGKWALIQVAFIAAFSSAMLVANAPQITVATFGSWCVAAFVTGIVATAVTDALWWYRIRSTNDRPLTVLGAIAVMGTVGIAFAVTQWVSTQALGLTLDRDPLLASVSGVLGVTMIGSAVIFLMNGRRLEMQRRAALLDQGIAVSLARQDVSDIAQRMQMALDADIDEALAPARRGIAERLAEQERALGDDEWAAIAQQLRDAAQDTVRPLSRNLWSRTAARLEPIRISVVVRNIVTKQPFQPWALASIYVIANFGNAIEVFGWLAGLALLAIGVTSIFVITGIANAAMRRRPAHHAAIFIGGSLALQLGGLLSFPLRAWAGIAPYTWAEYFVGVIVGLFVILLTSGVGSIRTYRDDVARIFQSDIDRELVDSLAASRQVAQLARESARILHGTVQTRLIACAVAIERAVDTSDVEAFQAALHEAHDVLVQPTRMPSVDAASLAEEVARKVSLWSGLCTIDIHIDQGLQDVSGRMARDVGRVVEEGLSNAIRHGGAGSIRVAVSRDGEDVQVVIDDDGTGPIQVIPGLGSSLLDSVSAHWSLTPRSPGARLEVTLQ